MNSSSLSFQEDTEFCVKTNSTALKIMKHLLQDQADFLSDTGINTDHVPPHSTESNSENAPYNENPMDHMNTYHEEAFGTEHIEHKSKKRTISTSVFELMMQEMLNIKKLKDLVQLFTIGSSKTKKLIPLIQYPGPKRSHPNRTTYPKRKHVIDFLYVISSVKHCSVMDAIPLLESYYMREMQKDYVPHFSSMHQYDVKKQMELGYKQKFEYFKLVSEMLM
ncbi:unnamed protein product [Ambrosiozyma monospora]|uniref:Unnamed protein product n=1 Tax=Ambrosiozyma monospora TaxID=43982 RepID=A0ACB5T0X9_AMBMO|nr:unnamed protein product [Ambrosiozyma monospora]